MFTLKVVLEGGQMQDWVADAVSQGFEETAMPVWVDTRSNGDLVWLFSLKPDGFPE
jgi:hypothetical protein